MNTDAKRDAWEKKILEQKQDDLRQRLPRTNAPESGPTSSSEDRDWLSAFSRKQSFNLNGSAQKMLRRMSIAKVSLSSSSSPPMSFLNVKTERRRNSTFAEVGLLRSSDPPKRRNGGQEAILEEEPRLAISQPVLTGSPSTPDDVQSPTDVNVPSGASNFTCLTRQAPQMSASFNRDSEISPNSYHRPCNGSAADKNVDGDDDKYSSPETESASETDRLGIEDDYDDAGDSIDGGDISSRRQSDVPILRLREGEGRGGGEIPGPRGTLESRGDAISDYCTDIRPSTSDANKDLSPFTEARAKEAILRETEAAIAVLREKLENAEKAYQKEKKDKLKEIGKLEERNWMLQNQIKFLNAEIQKLSRMLQQEQFKNHSKQLNIQNIQSDIDQLIRDFVFLLQSCIRLTCTDGPEMMELYMYGEKRVPEDAKFTVLPKVGPFRSERRLTKVKTCKRNKPVDMRLHVHLQRSVNK